MAKIESLNDFANLSNEQSAVAALNDNNTKIEDAFDNTLSRDGSTPNQMEASLDMNSNRILNLPAPLSLDEPIRLRDGGDPVDINIIDNSFLVSPFIETLLDDTNASQAQSTLGVSNFAKTLLDDADAEEAHTTLNVLGLRSTNLTLTVGAGGDFATLNDALAYASTFYPLHVPGATPSITINLLTGYTETTGINIVGIDLSYIRITAVDATVPAAVSGDLFHAENAQLPRILAKFDMNSTGGHGIWIANSRVLVDNPGGVIRAGKSGLYSIAMGRFTIADADFHGAQEYGAYIDHSSWGEIGDSDFSGAGQRGGNSDELGQPFNGIHIAHSSHVDITGATNAQLGGSPSIHDLRVRSGGICDITSEFIGDTFNNTNFLDGSGIIFSV